MPSWVNGDACFKKQLGKCLLLLNSFLKWTFIFPAQAEDQALLSEGEEQVDQRQWTQQHLEAADICGTPSLALTPPQADQEVDGLDVNVRGPGQYTVYNSQASNNQALTSVYF